LDETGVLGGEGGEWEYENVRKIGPLFKKKGASAQTSDFKGGLGAREGAMTMLAD